MVKSIKKIGGKPEGLIGIFLGYLMNKNHKKIYALLIKKISNVNNCKIIDIGCGAGKLIDKLSTRFNNSKIYGIDHSINMVKLAKKINKSKIKKNKVEIINTSVKNIPYESNMFSYSIACETIQFWPEIVNSLIEVNRILKNNGILLIANRFPNIDSKWYNQLQLKNIEEYTNVLKKSNFKLVDYYIIENSSWIIIVAKKIGVPRVYNN